MNCNKAASRRRDVGLAQATVLVMILVVACALRLHVNNSGMPFEVFPRNDEINYTSQVVNCLAGDFRLNYFINPSLYIYTVAAASSVVGWALVGIGRYPSFDVFVLAESLNPFHITVVGRLLSIAAACLSVVAIFFVARRLYSTSSGLLAALALAVNQIHCSRSPLLGNEATMVLLVLVFFLLLLAYMDVPSTSRHLACGLVLGLAISTKYNAGVHLVTFVVGTLAVVISAAKAPRVRPLSLAAWVGFPAVVAGFVAGSPSILTNFTLFVTQFKTQTSFLHEGWLPMDRLSPISGWEYYLVNFPRENDGLAFAVLCAIGLGMAGVRIVTRLDERSLLLVSAVVPSYLLLGSGIFVDMRFLLPAIPFVLILGVTTLDVLVHALAGWISSDRSAPRWVAVGARTCVVAVLVAVVFLPHTWATCNLMFRRYGDLDSRFHLVRWLHDNLDSDSKYVILAKPPKLRLLDRRSMLQGVPSSIRDSTSDTLNAKLRGSGRKTFEYIDLESLIAQSDSLEVLHTRLTDSGARSILIVLSRALHDEREDLGNFTRSTPIRECTYWPEFVRHLELTRSSQFLGDDMVAGLYQIPEARPPSLPLVDRH